MVLHLFVTKPAMRKQASFSSLKRPISSLTQLPEFTLVSLPSPYNQCWCSEVYWFVFTASPHCSEPIVAAVAAAWGKTDKQNTVFMLETE